MIESERERRELRGRWRLVAAVAYALVAVSSMSCGSVSVSADANGGSADAAVQPDASGQADAKPSPDGNGSNADASPVDGAPPAYNYAFISSEPHNAALGGLAGADTMCEQWATDAGIPGTYRALLSTTSVNAASRLVGARGWIRPDGRPVGDLPGQLFGPAGILAPIRITAGGEDVGAASVWSASGNNGIYKTTAGGSDCVGWTSTSDTVTAWFGFANTTTEWLDRGVPWGCDNVFYFYCFQVDHDTVLDVASFAEFGRRIFVSSGNFDVSTGMEGADALCAADVAADPDLTGATFRAYLADNGASAAARFTSNTDPIVRLDGLLVAADISALTTQDLVHPPNVRISGPPYDWRVFTGATAPAMNGTLSTTCTGWSDATSGNATEGFPYSTTVTTGDRRWFGSDNGSCAGHSGQIPIYCLEE